jgi:hypothetical protein
MPFESLISDINWKGASEAKAQLVRHAHQDVLRLPNLLRPALVRATARLSSLIHSIPTICSNIISKRWDGQEDPDVAWELAEDWMILIRDGMGRVRTDLMDAQRRARSLLDTWETEMPLEKHVAKNWLFKSTEERNQELQERMDDIMASSITSPGFSEEVYAYELQIVRGLIRAPAVLLLKKHMVDFNRLVDGLCDLMRFGR